MKKIIVTVRPVVAEAIQLILPDFADAEVIGRGELEKVLPQLEKGDVVAGNVDVPSLARITAAGAKFFGFGVSASKERLDTEQPTAEQLVSVEFKARLQEVVAYRDDSATLPDTVEVYSHQLQAHICYFLQQRGVITAVVGEVHPSQGEIYDKLRASGMEVREEPKAGMGRLGRGLWRGKTVVGHMMPRHATEYCTAGAEYFHFELPGRPDSKHNHNWTIEECKEFGATFVKYDVWRYGKSLRLFNESEDEINL